MMEHSVFYPAIIAGEIMFPIACVSLMIGLAGLVFFVVYMKEEGQKVIRRQK